MELVRLDQEILSRKPSELSGGQKQRVSLARVFIFDPKIILMDEPLGALDKNLREELQHEIKRIHSELGVTILYVTHNQDEAFALSDRVALLRGGELQQVGHPEEVYRKPINYFVASFFGKILSIGGSYIRQEDIKINPKQSDYCYKAKVQEVRFFKGKYRLAIASRDQNFYLDYLNNNLKPSDSIFIGWNDKDLLKFNNV